MGVGWGGVVRYILLAWAGNTFDSMDLSGGGGGVKQDEALQVKKKINLNIFWQMSVLHWWNIIFSTRQHLQTY